MSFRNKLLIIVGSVILASVLLSSAITYMCAERQLESMAKKEMEIKVALIAKQSEIALDTFKADIEVLAELTLVRRIAASPWNRAIVDEGNRYFQRIVKKAGVYQSINLLDRKARCIASNFPNRINIPILQQAVYGRADFHSALIGRSFISQIFLSQGTGRPIIVISVPVRDNGGVVAVLRAVLDLDHFNDYFLRTQEYVHGGKAYFFDPQLDATLPEGWKATNVLTAKPYIQPEVPDLSELATEKKGCVRYVSNGTERLVAFFRSSEPEFLFVVERPVQDVLAPIQTMRKVAMITLIALLAIVSVSVFFLFDPFLRKLEQCMTFVRDIEAGHFDKRLITRGNHELSRLARGLNAMAESLEEGRDALEEAERMYRGIFENAVEGIFVTNPEGFFINANPAIAQVLGYDSPSEIIGTHVTRYYSPERRSVLLGELQRHGTVKGFEITFRRKDGTERTGSLYVRADRDSEGRIVRIQGIGEDITEQKQIEEERRRTEEARRLSVQAQLEALRYQINPHFLFNVLNSLSALSESDPGRVPGLIRQLSGYLRSTLAARESGLVPLGEELEAITGYLNLEKVRFEENLAVSIHAPFALHDAMIPELLIQPLVENAVKHGMKTSPMPLQVDVSCREANGSLAIAVSNTGRWIGRDNGNGNGDGGVGLENIRKRLSLTYGDRYRLHIDEKNKRVYVTVEVPREGGNP
ncbi:MAG TPA: histidine kinase [Syntrophorhabdaceae bacterium]|nr:histidine kinase [Syntrophorhabdaceae bacterium]HQM80972.1 histidine kinase [Syntrophorhabdaceae bacterium]